MCGNDVSIISEPTPEIREKMKETLQTGQLSMRRRSLTTDNMVYFSGQDMSVLQNLQITHCQVSDQVVKQLMHQTFSSLQNLCLNHNNIGVEGCRALCDCKSLTALKTLELDYNPIGEGIKILGDAIFHLDLEDLSLNQAQINEDGLKSLNGHFPSLTFLCLGWNRLRDDTIDSIKALNGGKSYTFLSFSKNKFSKKLFQEFVIMPELKVLLIDRNKFKIEKDQYDEEKLYILN